MSALILKGVGKIDGDGWKDTTRVGEVVFVYGRVLPPPYAQKQYPRVGCVSWTASDRQYDFAPASWGDVLRLFPAIWSDRKDRIAYAFRWRKSQ